MRIPKHVAIIMDGNGRWAEKRKRPRIFGHVHGSARVRSIVRECGRLGVKHLTLYAFSSENWGRPHDEIQTLMRLLCKYLVRERKTLMKENVRLSTIGDTQKLPPAARDLLLETIELTKQNTGLNLNFALSYGSRSEILNAVKNLAKDYAMGDISKIETIQESDFEKYLYTREIPDPDLIIRTSGEMRLSNFLMWQAAYSEIHVTPKMWPEFTVEDLHVAFEDYSHRTRRFGLTDEQIKSTEVTQ